MTDHASEQQHDAGLSAAEIDARHASKLLERALAQGDRGELEQAILSCRQAVHLNTEVFVAHSLLAMLLRRSGRTKEAVESSEAAFALMPDSETEKLRLSQLRAAASNGQDISELFSGEWASFRQEMQRELKFNVASIPQDWIENLDVASLDQPKESLQLDSQPITPTPASRTFNTIWLVVLTLCVAVLIALVVWGLRSNEPDEVPSPVTSNQVPAPTNEPTQGETAENDKDQATTLPTAEPTATPTEQAATPQSTSLTSSPTPSQLSHSNPRNASSTPVRAKPPTIPKPTLSSAQGERRNRSTNPRHLPEQQPEVLPNYTASGVSQSKDPELSDDQYDGRASSGAAGRRYSNP